MRDEEVGVHDGADEGPFLGDEELDGAFAEHFRVAFEGREDFEEDVALFVELMQLGHVKVANIQVLYKRPTPIHRLLHLILILPDVSHHRPVLHFFGLAVGHRHHQHLLYIWVDAVPCERFGFT